jgi:glycosyltransferase involved in cell wall biosynthesis
MSVLFIAPLPEPITGQAVACQVFLDELENHHRVDVLNMNKREFTHGASYAGRFLEIGRIVFETWRRRNKADVIYLTISESIAGNAKDLMIYLACINKLSRVVIHLNGGAGFRVLMRNQAMLRRINAWFLRRIGGAIILGDRHRDLFAGMVSEERTHIVPNFAEEFLFADAATIERKFDNASPLRILFLSNLIAGKGYEELLDGFLALDPSARDAIRLDFAGGFASSKEERSFLERLRSVPQATYHGTVRGDAKRKLFHEAHLFALPTYYAYEGQPLSILEGYASGCAVMTTDHSGNCDVFTGDVHGYQVEPRSPSSITSALQRALQNPNELRTMGLANRQVADLYYRPATYQANMLRVMDAIAPRSRPSDTGRVQAMGTRSGTETVSGVERAVT